MLNFRIVPLILCIFVLATSAPAQVRVSKSAGHKSAMDMSGFSTGQGGAAVEFRRTLEADLMRSGWFQRSAPGKGEFTLSGSCEERGGQVDVKCRVYGVGDGRAYFNKTYREPSRLTRKMAHVVADEIVEAVTGRKGMASARIAMIGTMSGAKEVYVCDADGKNLVQLTNDKSVSVAPQWGPGGEQIVYTSYLKRFPDVLSIDVASGKREILSNFSGLNTGAAISPDGKDMAVILSKDGNPELYVMNLSSRRLTRITNTKHAAEASPTWSPDGRSLAYVSDSSGRPQIYVVSRRGGQPRRITSRGNENVAPDWGPNNLIAFSSRYGGQYHINVIDPDTRQMKELALDGADYEDPSWAPDGRHIVCTRTVRYRSQVYLLDTMGDKPIALTDNRGDWYSPSCSTAN